MSRAKNSLSERDVISIWHPFTPQLNVMPPVAIVRGDGALLFDEEGNSYIDAIASWWVNLHGHAQPYLAEKISAQLKNLEHVLFSGYTHEPAVLLAERLLGHLPYLNKVFYSDDGSTAVEVALKMAFQYWHNSDRPRIKVVAFENGYHGDTFGSMSVGARNVFSQAFDKMLFEVIHIPVPLKGCEEKSFLAMDNALQKDDVAAFIFEPLIQGAGGMVMYEAKALDVLIGKCKSKNVIAIADEVMTGFGRTGKMFATDYCVNKADIVCLSKGLTGGFLPMGTTVCTEKIHTAFLTFDKTKTFFHGHSYTANPIACTAALASLDLLEKNECWNAIENISSSIKNACEKFSKNKSVNEARSFGTILALEIKTPEATEYLNPLADRVHEFFPKHGIILRPLGNILYILPPYCITNDQLEKVFTTIETFLSNQN